MTAALVLSTDELRVSATLGGTPIPATLRIGWSTEDIPVADTVALRGMLARGLATAHEGDVRLAGELSIALEPFLTGRILVEVQRDGEARPGRRLIAKGAGGMVGCAEHRPDLWQVAPVRADLIDELLAELVDSLPDSIPSYPAVTLPTGLLVEAEHLSGMLTRRGLPPETAEIVTRVLDDLNATVTVRSVHRNGITTECTAITWLETGSMGVWLAVPDHDPRLGDEMAGLPTGLADHTELRPVPKGILRNELRQVLSMVGTERAG